MYKLQQIHQPNYMIAASLGIHPTTLSQYARGTREITAGNLVKICRVLECEPEEVLGTVEVEVQ